MDLGHLRNLRENKTSFPQITRIFAEDVLS